MERKLILLLVISVLFFSCSNDKANVDNLTDQTKLQGTWDASELKIDDQTAGDQAKFGRNILDHLTDKSCAVITLTFNADLSLVVENSMDYLSINVNSSGTGLDIPCPTESDSDATVYTFDGTTLNYIDANGQTINVNPVIEGNVMTIVAAELGYANLDAEGELVFTKR